MAERSREDRGYGRHPVAEEPSRTLAGPSSDLSEAISPSNLPQRRVHDALIQHRRIEPMTKEQCDFHIESVVGDRSATTLERALHAVFHRVDMQVQFVGGGFVAGPVVQELP